MSKLLYITDEEYQVVMFALKEYVNHLEKNQWELQEFITRLTFMHGETLPEDEVGYYNYSRGTEK